MNEQQANAGDTYQIRVEGVLRPALVDWLGDLQIVPQEDSTTLLAGRFPDQPALRGLLDQLWNLNFILVSVERIESQIEKDPPPLEQEGA
jgi:hypothetical protein